ncbi:MAG: hypothetical protein Q8P18_03340 [Pseudomonadota bacterium]|nr:hypothetical protein [Pseudomonadota bacterium]
MTRLPLLLLALLATLAHAAPSADPVPGREASTLGAGKGGSSKLGALVVSFKVDPRLTQSLYMGDRWVSPDRFSLSGGKDSATIEARVEGRDARGIGRPVTATWTTADPTLLTVSPTEGDAVTLTVHGPGKSTVRVDGGGITQVLSVDATLRGEVLVVEIRR